ncbi:HNH endonuclease [Phytopseudomonas dryadis]|uniref:HNH nuclease domain-containing protein n=1 Tax=Phytopseudomonas dryadis TaxID=2487520 RepID=A0A4Q9R2Z2_9GAMM|nr:HNH endonuclease [Pseudomonas dryadis]TBU94006.1 hypothetical protein DNK44_10085 [Pseudomonas dryadis]
MPFPKSVREEALVRAQRHCCVCHEFAGRSVNVHHIKQESEGGANTLENAIVLCLRCHAEAGHFNPNHPLGTKYAPTELIRHRDGWFKACESGTAKYSSHIEGRVKRIYTSRDLHKYVLLFSFHNGNKQVLSGWKLDILIPSQWKVSVGEVERYPDVLVEGRRYAKFQVASTRILYLGETCELTDLEWSKLEYSIDHDMYYAARADEVKVIWHFYSSAEPPVKGELLWEDLQQF